ncbi:sperm microtubule associated protein 2-like isoform X3 [Caretta caretta]|uniref:sperm microtubule associated protein 2-like isoform X3 n=1 Tax=Caretta caretta TaxID=8467 RepID=UPI00209411D7|nr:testicular haploid expressed gene protein-like isoform X4 [Caretta caretta]
MEEAGRVIWHSCLPSSDSWLLVSKGKVSYFCSYSSDRIRELARPKKPKAAWENYSSRLEWGNQQTIWPLSLSALTAQPTPRIMSLAKPKKIFDGNLQRRHLFLYSCGRMSEIWQRPPLMDLALPSPRILKLAEPKKYQTVYLKQRPRSSPEWPVPTAALTCEASQRVQELACPKSVHPGFKLDRKVETQIADTARMTLTPPRTQRLAQPKIQKNTLCYDRGSPESTIRPVSRAAQQAVASVRTLELAKAKEVPHEYLPARDTEWPVTKAAKHAVPTPRIEELSQPCKRPTANLAQFDPDAFFVKESAKKAVCSSRLQKLAHPIER